MRKAWRWLRHDSGIRLHGFCFVVAMVAWLAGQESGAAFFMACAVYWLIYDTPRAVITIHGHDCVGPLNVVEVATPTGEQNG